MAAQQALNPGTAGGEVIIDGDPYGYDDDYDPRDRRPRKRRQSRAPYYPEDRGVPIGTSDYNGYYSEDGEGEQYEYAEAVEDDYYEESPKTFDITWEEYGEPPAPAPPSDYDSSEYYIPPGSRGPGYPETPPPPPPADYRRRRRAEPSWETYPPEPREGVRYRGYPVQSFWDQMGFYNLIWDPRYNVKIPVMQIISIFALIIIFVMNYSINFDYVEQIGRFSPYVLAQPPEIAWLFALILAIFLSVFPRMEREFRVTISLGIIIIIILFFIGGPAIAMFATWDMMEIGTALANSLISFLKVLAVLLYWAPILLGVYGIIQRERMYLFLSVLFFLGIIITTDLALLSLEIEHSKTEASIPLFITFAVALFCFYEMADSSITFYHLNDSTRVRERYSPHQEHLNRILQKYFVFFIIFSALALVLTWFILDFNEVLKAMGSEQIAESIELNSIYGTIVALTVMVTILIIIGYIVRYDDKLKAFYTSFKSTALRVVPERMRTGRAVGVDDGLDASGKRLPPPPPKIPPAFPVAEDKGHAIIITDEL